MSIKDINVGYRTKDRQLNAVTQLVQDKVNEVIESANTFNSFTYVIAIDALHRVTIKYGALNIPSLPAWDQSFVRIGKALTSKESQFAVNIQANISGDTGATSSYEKIGLFVLIKTADPSGATQRDAVGIDGRAYINPAISTGRAWGMLSMAMILVGGDGMLCGHEIDVRNQGSDQASVELSTSKYGLQLVTIDNPATVGIFLTRQGTSTWHKGFFTKPAFLATGATFLELEGLFTVDRNGILTCQAARYGNESVVISGGVITITKSDIKIDTEGAAETDDLDTINGGVIGQVITLRTVDSTRDVVVKDLTGNIHLMGADRTLLDRFYRLTLMYDGTYWVMVSRNF